MSSTVGGRQTYIFGRGARHAASSWRQGDTSGKSDWCRETVFPELYFGGLVEALEEHMADGDLVFPEGK